MSQKAPIATARTDAGAGAWAWGEASAVALAEMLSAIGVAIAIRPLLPRAPETEGNADGIAEGTAGPAPCGRVIVVIVRRAHVVRIQAGVAGVRGLAWVRAGWKTRIR